MEALVEEWRRVKEDGRYEVSNFGRVRSWANRGKRSPFRRRPKQPRLLAQSQNPSGYYSVVIRGRSLLVHRLVARAFLGKRPRNHDTNHKDGVKTNNAVQNLEYITHAENCIHAVRNVLGLCRFGEHSATAKLNDDQVLAIRQSTGLVRDIAARFGVSDSTVSAIRLRRTWRHLTTEAA